MKTNSSSKILPRVDGARIAILQAAWHREYTDRMIACCKPLLQEAGCTHIEEHLLPGSLELPLAAQALLEKRPNIDAIIAFGIIVKGDTLHFEMIAEECMHGFGEVMRKYNVPILVEVLPVFDIAHAEARSRDDEWNKGKEAAEAAIEIIAWRRSL